MRFRCLNAAELAPLADEFIKFIALNGIDAGSWEKIKQTKPDEAEAFILDFSDMVFLRSLKNIKTIEFRTPARWRVFRFAETQAQMLEVHSIDAETTDLEILDLRDIFDGETHYGNIIFYKLEKNYVAERREDELFALLQSGATIAEDLVFEQLQGLI